MCKYCKNDDVDLNKDLISKKLCLGSAIIGEVHVNVFYNKLSLDIECAGDVTTAAELKIKYCPMCGRNIGNETY